MPDKRPDGKPSKPLAETWGEGMVNHVLLVTDSAYLHEESFFFAKELAKRMGLAINVLILADSGVSSDERRRIDLSLENTAASARAEGITAEAYARFGDQASELLKYLATHSGTRCLVWGGDPGIMLEPVKKNSSHWLMRVRGELDCPIAGALGKKA